MLRAGRKPSVLIRVAVDGVVEKVGPDAAVVQQRVAFAGRAVPDHGLAVVLAPDEELQQVPLRLLSPVRRTSSSARGCRTRRPARDPAAPRRSLDRLGAVVDRGERRSAATRRASAVPRRRTARARGGENPLGREQRKIREVLVIDRVELIAFHQPHQMGELHRDDAGRPPARFSCPRRNRSGRAPAPARCCRASNRPCRLTRPARARCPRRRTSRACCTPLPIATRATLAAGSMPSDGNAALHKVLQQIAVVAREFDDLAGPGQLEPLNHLLGVSARRARATNRRTTRSTRTR